ncbi:MAG: hypothetical protein ACREHC_04800 [Candidatus Levyibacteriota bacterium]
MRSESEPILSLAKKRDFISGVLEQRQATYNRIGIGSDVQIRFTDSPEAALRAGRAKNIVERTIVGMQSEVAEIDQALTDAAPSYLNQLNLRTRQMEEIRALADNGHIPQPVLAIHELGYREFAELPDKYPALQTGIEQLQQDNLGESTDQEDLSSNNTSQERAVVTFSELRRSRIPFSEVSLDRIRQIAKEIPKDKPITVFTPVNRYLGFSAPVPPSEQLQKIANEWGVPLQIKDPSKVMIHTNSDSAPVVMDEHGPIDGSVFFGFGHEPLDRNMVRFLMIALEKMGKKVINGERALTMADDKALLALALADHPDIPTAQSVITSARGNVDKMLDALGMEGSEDKNVIHKVSGFSAGGVGTMPIPASVDYIAPAIWASRSDAKPRIIQNDVDGTPPDKGRKVIRAYVVGDQVAGCYVTEGYGIVNCAGLARESEGYQYTANPEQEAVFIEAARAVGSEGYCRIDAAGGDNFYIYEVNPLARFDAEKYGLQIQESLLWYAMQLATEK